MGNENTSLEEKYRKAVIEISVDTERVTAGGTILVMHQ